VRFFGFKWFGQTKPARLLIYLLKYFQGFKFTEIFNFSCILCVLEINTDRCENFQYTNRFIVKFPRFTLFCVFSVYEQIFRVFSQYDSYMYLENAPQIVSNLSELNYFLHSFLRYTISKNSMYVCHWTKDSKWIINYLALVWQTNFFLLILIIRGITFKFKYQTN
jgi:hypothetical protein